MERPNDIPEDVWEVAERSLHPAFRIRVYKSPVANLQLEGIARAILAERERCAKVAERKWRGAPMYPDGADIAVDIRNGEQP